MMRVADDATVRLLLMEQWRAGIQGAEALSHEVANLSPDT